MTSLQARLTWTDPTTGDVQDVVCPFPVTIGRSQDNAVFVNSKLVSRFHALIQLEDGTPVLYDQNSTNGVLLRGRLVKTARLNDGESFQIGPFVFTLLLRETEDQPEVPIVVFYQRDGQAISRRASGVVPMTIGRDPECDVQLADIRIEPRHASIHIQDGQWILIDHSTEGGTEVNGQSWNQGIVRPGDVIRIGAFNLRISPESLTSSPRPSDATVQIRRAELVLTFDQDAGSLAPDSSAPESTPAQTKLGEFPPPAFLGQSKCNPADLMAVGYEVRESEYLSIGGGLGSFAWVNWLRVSGAATNDIQVLGVDPKPYSRFKQLAEHSQIRTEDRLRSNSDARPDNLWGWPGYGAAELGLALRRGKLGQALRVAFQLFGEPDLSETYTPKASAVFEGLDREAARIGWDQIWQYGRVRAIRKTSDDRYLVAYSQTRQREAGRVHKFALARHLHLAVGYPAVRFLDDLQRYREQSRDFRQVVNAYEAHDHMYEQLREQGGTVLLRGRGIVAARVLQRVAEVQAQNPAVRVLHLMRSPNRHGQRYLRATRDVHHHWELQPFNWPKSSWGGELREVLEKASATERDQLFNDWGGTTTSDKKIWQRVISAGLESGWYRIAFGHVVSVSRHGKQVITAIQALEDEGRLAQLEADFVIDATGLVASVDHNPLLKDLLETYHLQRNSKRRLDVTADFEIPRLRNGAGRAFASGSMLLGGAFAPVDSFLGLQYGAQRAVELLAANDARGLKRLGGLRSLGQWLRWTRNQPPD
jgi:pSer/pThr/pTyr-binding forkhead associated (FHA) protein